MRFIYILLIACLSVLPVIADELPDLGDVSATVLSPLQEKKIVWILCCVRSVGSSLTAKAVAAKAASELLRF